MSSSCDFNSHASLFCDKQSLSGLENKAALEAAKPVDLHASNANNIINSESTVTFAGGTTAVINCVITRASNYSITAPKSRKQNDVVALEAQSFPNRRFEEI